jgi:hypothetical protein
MRTPDEIYAEICAVELTSCPILRMEDGQPTPEWFRNVWTKRRRVAALWCELYTAVALTPDEHPSWARRAVANARQASTEAVHSWERQCARLGITLPE